MALQGFNQEKWVMLPEVLNHQEQVVYDSPALWVIHIVPNKDGKVIYHITKLYELCFKKSGSPLVKQLKTLCEVMTIRKYPQMTQQLLQKGNFLTPNKKLC